MSWIDSMGAPPQAIPDLDRKDLRSFGFTTGAIVAVLFGLFFPWALDHAMPLWPWILSGVLIVWASIAPVSLRPAYKLWMRFGLLMSRFTTPLILGILFFGLITPTAFILSLMKWDPLSRRLDGQLNSYRVKSRLLKKHNLEKPF